MSDSEGESYEKQVKIVLVGDGSAGKVKIQTFSMKNYSNCSFFFVRLQFQKDFLKMHLIVIIIKH